MPWALKFQLLGISILLFAVVLYGTNASLIIGIAGLIVSVFGFFANGDVK